MRKKVYCQDCGLLLHANAAYLKISTKRCHSCNNKGHRNAQYKDGRWNKKYFCEECGHLVCYDTAYKHNFKHLLCKKCCIKGNKHYNFKGGLPKCIDCGKLLSRYGSKRCRKHHYLNCKKLMKGKYKGNKNPMYGKVTNSKKIKYKSIWMRSTWEAKYADYLDKKQVRWLYEPQTFDLGDITYTPDFYLPDAGIYVEIKGFFHPKAQRKLTEFKKKFPHVKVILLMEKELKKLKLI